MVSLVAWKSPRNVPNFGDDLSQVIVSLMLARRGRTLEDEAVRATSLLAIGSIIHFAPEGATLWGSGVNGKIPEHFHRYRGLDVRAVRGPYTREWLMRRKIAVPEIYGDPALLLPELCQGRFQPSGAGGTIFVPNLNDILAGTEVTLPAGVPLVSPMRSWHRVVADIVAARFVVASSLHGVVIAEAFGIPARYVRLSEHENLFKFQDYYAGTGRGSFAYARSIEEALEMGGEAAPVFDSAALKRAFPLDLWR
ncbi:hypothetical protein LPB142_08275 [Rhodobacter xanthinilyticus]|uniref:Polysaccharide pyruvyl transferase domain-containing protein n=2 Tax=Rhodobacter xanthinilyticus TaxID=1850250 RepID=A0A1D9MGG1_9RHOB|nr:hypothetical protein LPB142_08275 [Rhodobacter xanthinilyticus]